jgi:hypothetical protein
LESGGIEMGKTKDMLDSVITAISYTRRLGNTSALVEMLKNNNGKLVVHDHSHGETLKRNSERKIDIITLGNIDNIRGFRCPLFFDNATVFAIADTSLSEINRLEAIIFGLKNDLINRDATIAEKDKNLRVLQSRLEAIYNRCIAAENKIYKIEEILDAND